MINVTAAKRVHGLIGVNLYELVDDGFRPLSELISNPIRLSDVLYALCKDEADAREIGDEDFGRAMAGDVLTLAADAFVEELIDFFPDARTRAILRKVVAAGKTMRDKLLDHAETVLATIDPVSEANALIVSFGNSLVSSASTQDHSHSASSS